jgi:hypothetical protein
VPSLQEKVDAAIEKVGVLSDGDDVADVLLAFLEELNLQGTRLLCTALIARQAARGITYGRKDRP